MHVQELQSAVYFAFHITVCSDSCLLCASPKWVVHLYSWLWLCLLVRACVCVSFGSRLLPLVSKAFHSEPDKIPPAYTAVIRRRTMQSSLQANAHTLARSHTDRHRWVSASWCVCVVCNIAEELITRQEFYFFFFICIVISQGKKMSWA